MTRTLAVIQARLGSQRLPGKMLEPLGSDQILGWVVKRSMRSQGIDRLVVATTREASDDELVDYCEHLGVEVFRGDTEDVLSRFMELAAMYDPERVVRICADNPFIDAACVDVAIKCHIESSAQYVYNHRPHGECDYADGFGAEVISRALLKQLGEYALSPIHREHVTLAVVDGSISTTSRGCHAPPALAFPHLRFDVDTLEDLGRLRELVERFGVGLTSSAAEVIATEQRRLAQHS
jgi:spore coat polysaccharide biosynthesis protein SpsF